MLKFKEYVKKYNQCLDKSKCNQILTRKEYMEGYIKDQLEMKKTCKKAAIPKKCEKAYRNQSAFLKKKGDYEGCIKKVCQKEKKPMDQILKKVGSFSITGQDIEKRMKKRRKEGGGNVSDIKLEKVLNTYIDCEVKKCKKEIQRLYTMGKKVEDQIQKKCEGEGKRQECNQKVRNQFIKKDERVIQGLIQCSKKKCKKERKNLKLWSGKRKEGGGGNERQCKDKCKEYVDLVNKYREPYKKAIQQCKKKEDFFECMEKMEKKIPYMASSNKLSKCTKKKCKNNKGLHPYIYIECDSTKCKKDTDDIVKIFMKSIFKNAALKIKNELNKKLKKRKEGGGGKRFYPGYNCKDECKKNEERVEKYRNQFIKELKKM